MKKAAAILLALAMVVSLCACGTDNPADDTVVPDEGTVDEVVEQEPQGPGQVFMYGETHGNKETLEKELELWKGHYNNGLRHLFLEDSYFGAYMLNLWMQEEDDAKFDTYFSTLKGTANGSPFNENFFKEIKASCPETVFHGFDIGHQYNSLGVTVQAYMDGANLKESKEYQLVSESIEQGQYFYTNSENPEWVYREEKMVSNFVREMETLNGEDVMVILGSQHANIEGMDVTGTIPCFANQLVNQHSLEVTTQYMSDLVQPRNETLTIGGKEYAAVYYSEDYIGHWAEGYISRCFWHVKDAYEDFKYNSLTGNMLPSSNFAMEIAQGEIYAIRYTLNDGSTKMEYMRTDGDTFEGMLVAVEFTP